MVRWVNATICNHPQPCWQHQLDTAAVVHMGWALLTRVLNAGHPVIPSDQLHHCTQMLASALELKDQVLAAAAAAALGHIGLRGPLNLPAGPSGHAASGADQHQAGKEAATDASAAGAAQDTTPAGPQPSDQAGQDTSSHRAHGKPPAATSSGVLRGIAALLSSRQAQVGGLTRFESGCV